jgi:hypothetical protein
MGLMLDTVDVSLGPRSPFSIIYKEEKALVNWFSQINYKR